METAQPKRRIAWYRVPLSRDDLSRFNRRSDLMGLLQTGGYLGLLAVTGSAAFFSLHRLPWPVVVLLTFFPWDVLGVSHQWIS